jgi:hypothetical protein
VPFALRAIRRRDVFLPHLVGDPPRQPIGAKTRAEMSGSGISGSSGNTGR